LAHPHRRRGREAHGFVHLDSVVDVGGVTLASDERVEDWLTKGLWTLACLTGTTAQRPMSERYVGLLAARFDWLLRHRLSLGVERFTDWRPEHLENLFLRMSAGPNAELVPIEARIRASASIDAPGCANGAPGPIDGAPPNARASAGLYRLAVSLGVTPDALRGSRVAVEAIRAQFGERFGSLTVSRDGTSGERDYEDDDDCDDRGDTTHRARAITEMTCVVQGIAYLASVGRLPHDPMGFRPDWERTVVTAIRHQAWSRPRAETLTTAHLTTWNGAAARWVVVYSSHIIGAYRALRRDADLRNTGTATFERRIRRSMALDAALPPGMPPVLLYWHWPHRQDPRLSGRLTVIALVTLLYTACLVIVASFGALSMDEVAGLLAGCVAERTPSLPVLCLKGDKALGELAEIPFCELGRMAIEVMEALSAERREAVGGTALNIVLWGSSGAPRPRSRHLPTQSCLRIFAKHNGLPFVDPENGVMTTGVDRRGRLTP